MHVAVNSAITTGVALVGAGVIAVTPIEPPAPDVRVVEQDVSLTASSLLYAPVNAVEMFLSAPANMVAAMDRLATALTISGSWNDKHPNNVWGWDPANPAMFRAAVDMLIPFPAFSEPWGRHLDWWATANLPMYEGCAYECPDLPGMLDGMFKVPMSAFYDDDGYTFPEVINPTGGAETEWSEQQVILDPAEPLKSVWAALTAEPTGIETTTWYEVVTAVANLAASMQVTGHLPDWVAVREIETFFKHFLPAPEEEATSLVPADDTEPSAAASAAVPEDGDLVELSTPLSTNTLRSVAADEPTTEVAPDEDPVESLIASEVSKLEAALQRTPVEDEPAEVVDEGDAVEVDADEAGAEAQDEATEAEDDTDTAATEDDTSSSGGKHRKADDAASDAPSDKAHSSSDSDAGDSGDSED